MWVPQIRGMRSIEGTGSDGLVSGGGFGIGEEGLVGDLGSGSDVRDRPHAVRAVEAPTAANVRNVLRARGVAGGMKAIRFFAGVLARPAGWWSVSDARVSGVRVGAVGDERGMG